MPRDGLTNYLLEEYVRTVQVVDGVDVLEAAVVREMLHTDYGGYNTFRLVNDSGDPVEAAIVTVYLKDSYDAGDFTAPLGVTATNYDGRWVDAIAVAGSTTYTVHYQKAGVIGPVTVEIVVP